MMVNNDAQIPIDKPPVDLINGVATSILTNSSGSVKKPKNRNEHSDQPSSSTITEYKEGSTCSIYKVPKFMRKKYEECYRPLVLSIGPFYYGDPLLEDMEELKQIFFDLFFGHINEAHKLNEYIALAECWEEDARAYYQEKIELSSETFIDMLLRDAAFIIYLFMLSSSDFKLENPCIGNKLAVLLLYRSNDLFLLENQLPFFILESLYNKAFGPDFTEIPSFRNLTLNYFARASISGFNVAKAPISQERITNNEDLKIEHLLDFWRICFWPEKLRNEQVIISHTDDDVMQASWTAKELVAAGVKFVPSEDHCINVKFDNGVLKIPKFCISDYAERFFFNMQLFEQYHYFMDSYFIDFIYLLDKMIDTVEDVKVLVENKILVNFLGSEQEVADLINKAGKNIYIFPKNYYYSDVTKRMNDYVSGPWPKWRYALKTEYFKYPWAATSVVYAVIILLLALAQTFRAYVKL